MDEGLMVEVFLEGFFLASALVEIIFYFFCFVDMDEVLVIVLATSEYSFGT